MVGDFKDEVRDEMYRNMGALDFAERAARSEGG